MDDASLATNLLEKPAPIATNGVEAFALTFGDTFDRTNAMFDAGLRYWQAECLRFVEDVTTDGQAAFARLCESKTPLDLISAEQEWLRARSRSFLEAGLRLVDAYAAASRSAKDGGVRRLETPRRKRDRAA